MYVRKVKRICGVRGCRNTQSYSVSLSREAGNSIIICQECAKKVFEALKDEPAPVATALSKNEPAALFYHPEIENVAEEETEAAAPAEIAAPEEENENVAEELDEELDPEATAYICPNCKKGFKTERGLKQHMKSCIKTSQDKAE